MNEYKISPLNLGMVAAKVEVFPFPYPLKERNRQYHEMMFNQVTVDNISVVDGKDKVDMVSTGDAGSNYGVTLKPVFSIENNYFCTRVASEDARLLKFTQYEEVYDPSELVGVSLEDSTKKIHFTFVKSPNIYQSSTTESNYEDLEDKEAISNFVNSYLDIRYGISEQQIKGPRISAEEEEIKNIQFIYNATTFSGSFNDLIPDELRNFHRNALLSGSIGSGTLFPDGKEGDKVDVYKGVSPGSHCAMEKLVPIFPGEDFQINFIKMTPQHPLSLNTIWNKKVENNVEKRYQFFSLSEEYSSLDCFNNSVQNFPGVTLSNNPDFQIKYNSETKTCDKSGYYYAAQPYIIIEMPATTPRNTEVERLFLIIPKDGKVVLVNSSKRPRILEEKNAENQTEKWFIKPDFYMSKIIYDFGFSGNVLLSMDSFVVKFQHMYGYLQVTFNSDASHIIAEETYNKKVLDQLNTGNNAGKKIISKIDSAKSNMFNFTPERDAIILIGKPKILWGNSKYAFNFSPIEYEESAKIKPNYPIPVIGRFKVSADRNESVGSQASKESEKNTFILLRTRGYDPEQNFDSFVTPGLENFDDFRFGIFKNQANVFGEIVQGVLVKTKANVMPSDMLNYIPGSFMDLIDFESGLIDQTRFKYNYAIKPSESSSISISKTKNQSRGQQDSSESDNYSLFTNVTLELNSYPINLINPWTLEQLNEDVYSGRFCRPILFSYSALIKDSDDPAVNVDPIDISHFVKNFNESWIRESQNFISHRASLNLYIPKDGSLSDSLNQRSPQGTSDITIFGSEISGNGTAPFILGLQDKQFFIKVYLGRLLSAENGSLRYHPVFPGSVQNACGEEIKEPFLCFTGLCNQVNYTMSTSHIDVNMVLEDYTKILNDQVFLNPPFYDAVRDYDAVYDVLNQAGFRKANNPDLDGYCPLDFMHNLVVNGSISDADEGTPFLWNGNTFYYFNYILPGNYDPLNTPRLKPNIGDNYLDFIKKISDISGKTFYFDRLGIAHFDIPPDEIEYFANNNFTSSAGSGSSWDPSIKYEHSCEEEILDFYISIDSNKFDSGKFATYNVVTEENFTFNKKVSDIFSEVRVISTTPDMKLLLAAHLNVNAIFDPTLPGFLGYRKTFLQKDGVFGSAEALEKIVNRYSMFFNPPLSCSFTVPGRVGIMPNQYFRLHYNVDYERDESGEAVRNPDGTTRRVPLYIVGIIMEVTNDIDKSRNSWTTKILGQYKYPGNSITFSKSSFAIGIPS